MAAAFSFASRRHLYTDLQCPENSTFRNAAKAALRVPYCWGFEGALREGFPNPLMRPWSRSNWSAIAAPFTSRLKLLSVGRGQVLLLPAGRLHGRPFRVRAPHWTPWKTRQSAIVGAAPAPRRAQHPGAG